jgi:Ca2+-binding EF-hand superfamily protein
MGKDVKFLYQALDKDQGGTLDIQEILIGLKEKFFIYFSPEEAAGVLEYLDSDGSGDVDFEEFQEKINYNNYNKYYHCFLLTKQKYIELVLKEWELHKQRTRSKILEKFEQFDDNGDGVLTFDEFEALIINLDPAINRNEISEMFNETLELEPDEDDPDKMSPESF